MKILIRLPNWLGDAVMATPAIDTILEYFPQAKYTLVAPENILALFRQDQRFHNYIADSSKKSSSRIFGIYHLAKKIGNFDLAITFRNSFSCTLLLHQTKSTQTVGTSNLFRKILFSHPIPVSTNLHQAQIYQEIVNKFLGISMEAKETKLVIHQKEQYQKPTMGIAPGATYGTAKRWSTQKFADVAMQLSNQYDIVILGSPNELETADEIQAIFKKNNITNWNNLVGQTSIAELLQKIAGLSLFITNDSGPMHIAGAFQIPTVAIFGPTIPQQTHPWKHPHLQLVYKQVPCAPCMKRNCPYSHHRCMEDISVQDVLYAIQLLTQD